jgi:tRNA A37 threonylcarbamoyladenosine synthetase subunit TsaC/SUA5/YrdC
MRRLPSASAHSRRRRCAPSDVRLPGPADAVATRLANWQFRIVRQGIPGAFTFLVPATREVPRRLQHPRRRTIGVRVPDHPVVRALLAELGAPILSTTLILPGGARRSTTRKSFAIACRPSLIS